MVRLPQPKTSSNLLRGVDLKSAVSTVEIVDFRFTDVLRNRFVEVEGKLQSPVITVKSKTLGQRDLALNKTNYRVLLEKLGDDSDDWMGRKIRLHKIMQRNPTTREVVPSIAVEV